MSEFKNGKLPPEIEEGNIEYKRKLNDKDEDYLTKLATQALWRMDEGYSRTGIREAVYYIGIDDDGNISGLESEELQNSIQIFRKILDICNADIYDMNIFYFDKGSVSKIIIRKSSNIMLEELRICFLGAPNSGKSTLVGVLCYGNLDNGNGSSRNNIFRYSHEFENGNTSSITYEIIGYNETNIINFEDNFTNSWSDIIKNSTKIIDLIDLPGSLKFFKTTIFGILSNKIDYSIIVIGNEITNQTLFHLILCHKFNIPYIVVFTKIDKIKTEALNNIIKKLENLIRSKINNNIKLIDIDKKLTDKIELFNNNVPFIRISNVTGSGIKNLHDLLKNLKLNREININEKREGTEFMINDIIYISEVGWVVIGLLFNGIIKINDKLFLGPIGFNNSNSFNNHFIDVSVKSIHKKQISSSQLNFGEQGSLVIKFNKKNNDIRINKHLMLVSTNQLTIFKNSFNIIIPSNETIIVNDDNFIINKTNINFKEGLKLMVNTRNIYDRININNIEYKDDKIILKVNFCNGNIQYIKTGENIIIRYGSRFIFGKINI